MPNLHPEEQLSISRQTESGISIAGISLIGGAIEKLTLAGASIISTEKVNSPDSMFFGSLLAPWPNRLAAATYSFRGRQYQTSHIDRDGNSNHGLVFDRPAQIVAVSEDSLKLMYQFGEDEGYPFKIRLDVEYKIFESEFEVTAIASNLGDDAPFGLGFHPYFLVGDSFLLEADFSKHLEVDKKMIPVGEQDIQGLRYQGGTMDDCFYGASRVFLSTESHKLEVVLISGFEYFMLYRPDKGSGASLLAIEPMSCRANAFNTEGEDLVIRNGESREFGFSIRRL